jgi:DNA-binding transcriptional MerR regulator
LYRVYEFARLAGVTFKALHHYDRVGLLKPRRADSGYRLYAEQDLARLEQIVALKFLGLPLQQIRILLDRAIEVISKAEQLLHSGEPAGSAVLKEIIEAIEMQNEPRDAASMAKPPGGRCRRRPKSSSRPSQSLGRPPIQEEHYGEIVWVKDLDPFTLEERERFSLASVDLYFKIAGALDQDPPPTPLSLWPLAGWS